MGDSGQFGVRISGAGLEAALKHSQTCVGGNLSDPILGHVLLEAKSSMLAIRTTDMSQALRVQVPCVVVEPGTIALPARRLLSLVSDLSKHEICIWSRGTSLTHIDAGGLKSTMPTLGPANFPTPFAPCEDWKAQFEPGKLAGLIRRILPTLGDQEEEAGLTLGSALMRVTPFGVLMVTTDTQKLSRSEYQDDTATAEDWDVLLPRKMLKTLLTLFPAICGARIDIGMTREAIFFRGGQYLLGARRVPGKFPAFERAIPSWESAILVPARELIEAVERVREADDALVSTINFDLHGGVLKLRTQSKGSTEGVEELAVEWAGADLRFCLRTQYLQGCLAQLRRTRQIAIGIPNAVLEGTKGVPIAISATQDEPFNTLYLLMPAAVSIGARP